MKETKKKILIFTDYYLPGYKAGGPIRSVSNMVKILNDYYSFLIITRDRDQLDKVPYNYIRVNEWDSRSQVEICYTNSVLNLRRLLSQKEFDIYYLNSLFSFRFSIKLILLRKFRLVPIKKIILAPRGELLPGALSMKSIKKKTFLMIVKVLRLYANIVWHAASIFEAEAIKNEFGQSANIQIAEDLVLYNNTYKVHRRDKINNHLRILFISRIVKIKNLKFVIRILNLVKGNFTLDIYGSLEDKKYWIKCQNLISSEIRQRINYRGVIDHNHICEVYPNYDLLFFPTLGESFGHVIFEALTYGTPILCSDESPWNKLTHFNAGWNFKLNNAGVFKAKIEDLICLDQENYKKFVNGCFEYVKVIQKENNSTEFLRLFSDCLK